MPPYSDIDDRQWAENAPALFYAAKIARTPYQTIHGPDVVNVSVARQGSSLKIIGTVDDTANGDRPIAAAAYTIDVPPWIDEAVPVPLSPTDGAFDGSVESIGGEIPLAGLPGGSHILYVQGRDNQGDWGPVSAAFFQVEGGTTAAGALAKQAAESLTTPGGEIVYRIDHVLTLAGDNHTYSTRITDILPPDLEVLPQTIAVNGIPQPGLYDSISHTLNYESDGTFEDEVRVRIDYRARVSPLTAIGQLIVNEVSVEAFINDLPVRLMPAADGVLVVEIIERSFLPATVKP
jgi:hypothetical protein